MVEENSVAAWSQLIFNKCRFDSWFCFSHCGGPPISLWGGKRHFSTVQIYHLPSVRSLRFDPPHHVVINHFYSHCYFMFEEVCLPSVLVETGGLFLTSGMVPIYFCYSTTVLWPLSQSFHHFCWCFLSCYRTPSSFLGERIIGLKTHLNFHLS